MTRESVTGETPPGFKGLYRHDNRLKDELARRPVDKNKSLAVNVEMLTQQTTQETPDKHTVPDGADNRPTNTWHHLAPSSPLLGDGKTAFH